MSKAEQIITLVGDLEEENLHLQNNLYFLQEQLDRARFRQDQVLRALDAEFIRLQDLDSAIPLTANYEERRRRHNENANSRLSLNRVAQALFNISLYTAASSVRQEKVRYEKSQA